MTTTVGQIIRRARDRDPAFAIEHHENRVVLSRLSTEHRRLLKLLADPLTDRISETRAVAAVINNALVGVDANGTVFAQPTADGFDVSVDTATAVAITSSSAASPTVITTTAVHGYATGDSVTISGHGGSDDDDAVNASHQVTVVTTTTFTIPVDLTGGAGTSGSVVLNKSFFANELVAFDPFNDGFVLPATLLHLIDIYAIMTTSSAKHPITVLPQSEISRRAGYRDLMATMNGFRLLPLLNPPLTISADTLVTNLARWRDVSSVVVVWIDAPVRFEETGDWAAQTLALPDTYADYLEHDLAAFLGRRELSRNPEYLPSLVADYKTEADRELEIVMRGAAKDHRSVKVHQNRVNR